MPLGVRAGFALPAMIFVLILAAAGTPGQGLEPPCPNPNVVPMGERISKSELTRNFLALTVYRPAPGAEFRRIPELENFPGWTDAAEPVLDSDGGWIYAFAYDEAGVGVSYFWLLRRARFTDPKLSPTPRQLAYSMAGLDPSACDLEVRPTPAGLAQLGSAADHWCGRVRKYLDEWLGLAPLYFAEPPGPNDVLQLADPDELWNWMRVMYHHESGRTPVVDRATFERGVQLAADYIRDGDRLVRPIGDYLYPCGEAVAVSSGDAPAGSAPAAASMDEAELRGLLRSLDALDAEIESMRARVDDLRGQVEAALAR